MKNSPLDINGIATKNKLTMDDLLKVVNESREKRHLGFMLNEGIISDDIHWGDDEIMAMFEESFDENFD